MSFEFDCNYFAVEAGCKQCPILGFELDMDVTTPLPDVEAVFAAGPLTSLAAATKGR